MRVRTYSTVDSPPPQPHRTAPLISGVSRSQITGGAAPPTIWRLPAGVRGESFVNSTKLFDATYQRYLLNIFREKLPFRDIPIKLYMRSRKQTEPGERSSHRDRS